MSALPDVCTELRNDIVIVVANKKAREVLNQGFEKPRPRWGSITDGPFSSSEYRAITLDGDWSPMLAAMLCAVHLAGLQAMFMCEHCRKLHLVDDERAKRVWFHAIEGAKGVAPAHETLQ
jgi:hypothetical protein